MSKTRDEDYRMTTGTPFDNDTEAQPVHEPIGACAHCNDTAYTRDHKGNKSCWACAYNAASWGIAQEKKDERCKKCGANIGCWGWQLLRPTQLEVTCVCGYHWFAGTLDKNSKEKQDG